MNDILGPLIAAVVAGLVTLVAVTFSGVKGLIHNWLVARAERIKMSRFSLGLEKLAEFQTWVGKIRNVSNVGRVLLFVGSNCGGMPTPGKPYRVKAILGSSTKDERVLDRYNFDLTVDAQHVMMLARMVNEGKVINTVSAMPDSEGMKAFYVDEKVVQSCLFFIKLNEDASELSFLSVASYDREFTPAEHSQIDLIVQRLRSIMNRL